MVTVRRFNALAVAAGIALLLVGCTTQSVDGSRHTLYESVNDLAAASTAIIVGTVSDQMTLDADVPTTVSTFNVQKTFSMSTLGKAVDGEISTVDVGAEIAVRQPGTAGMSSTPAPLLEKGTSYLLFITPTMLNDSSASSQFYVTGGDAGLYMTEGSEFVRVVNDSGDSLPAKLTVTDFE